MIQTFSKMVHYHTSTLNEYLERLAAREPVPGGGSAAALSAALGAALLEMVAQYSLNKGKPAPVERRIAALLTKAGEVRRRLLELVSLDAEAYLEVVAARKKDKAAQKKAAALARNVPREIKKISEKALGLVPYLRKEGNKYLLSDVDAAENFLTAAVKTAQVMMETP